MFKDSCHYNNIKRFSYINKFSNSWMGTKWLSQLRLLITALLQKIKPYRGKSATCLNVQKPYLHAQSNGFLL